MLSKQSSQVWSIRALASSYTTFTEKKTYNTGWSLCGSSAWRRSDTRMRWGSFPHFFKIPLDIRIMMAPQRVVLIEESCSDEVSHPLRRVPELQGLQSTFGSLIICAANQASPKSWNRRKLLKHRKQQF